MTIVVKSLATTVEEAGKIKVDLPGDHRIVILETGQRPTVVPLAIPGTYEVEIEPLDARAFPLILTIVPVDQLRYMEKLPQSEIDRVIAIAPRQSHAEATVH